MSAYLIVTAQIHDREAFVSGYAPAAAALVERFGGRYLVRKPGAQLLEGEHGDGTSVVISEWPDHEAALAFWHSEEYSKVRRLRDHIAAVNVLIV